MLASLLSHQIAFGELLGDKSLGHSNHQNCSQSHWKVHDLTPPVLKVDRPATRHIKGCVRNHITSNAILFLGKSEDFSGQSHQPISFPNQAPLKYRNFYLYSAVSPICYDNISIRIYSYSSWCIKLSISFSIWSKLQYEFSLLVKYLYGLKQKPEYGIVSNVGNLLPVHLLTKLGIAEFPGTPPPHFPPHPPTMGEKVLICPSTSITPHSISLLT